jgi:hypothetical protein
MHSREQGHGHTRGGEDLGTEPRAIASGCYTQHCKQRGSFVRSDQSEQAEVELGIRSLPLSVRQVRSFASMRHNFCHKRTNEQDSIYLI